MKREEGERTHPPVVRNESRGDLSRDERVQDIGHRNEAKYRREKRRAISCRLRRTRERNSRDDEASPSKRSHISDDDTGEKLKTSVPERVPERAKMKRKKKVSDDGGSERDASRSERGLT